MALRKLICLGDSITEGEYSQDGSERLTPRLRSALPGWTVRNAGIQGDHAHDALARLTRDVLCHNPDRVLILLGANDAAFHKLVSLSAYLESLTRIVSGVTPQKAILITPSPVDEARMFCRSNSVMAQYAGAVRSVAFDTGCRCIDLFTAMLATPHYPDFLSDGVHFTEAGYVFLAELVLSSIDWF